MREVFDDIQWREDLVIKTPTIEDAVEVGKVLHESYKGGIHYEEFSNNTQEKEIEYAKMFLERYISTNSIQASTLVYDRNTTELMVFSSISSLSYIDFNSFSIMEAIFSLSITGLIRVAFPSILYVISFKFPLSPFKNIYDIPILNLY